VEAEHCQEWVDTKRPRPLVENDEYEAFIRRMLRAYAHRVGSGDIEALALMPGLAEIDTSITEAVNGLHGCDYYWAEIDSRLGITRQATQQRWGSTVLMSARYVTNWTWPQVQVVVSRRLLLHARKLVQVMPDSDLQDIRRGPQA
jgi:hypothetical protein